MEIDEYTKNKNQYLNSKFKGGNFNFIEKNYYEEYNKLNNDSQYKIPKNPKYIAGPVSFTIMHRKEDNRIIYMFGDLHNICNENSFYCGDNDEKTTVYLPDYLNQVFKTNKDLKIDFFVEAAYLKETQQINGKINYEECLLSKTINFFGDCFDELKKRENQINTKCRKHFNNIRFHLTDIRKTRNFESSKKNLMSEFVINSLQTNFVDDVDILGKTFSDYFSAVTKIIYNFMNNEELLESIKKLINVNNKKYISNINELNRIEKKMNFLIELISVYGIKESLKKDFYFEMNEVTELILMKMDIYIISDVINELMTICSDMFLSMIKIISEKIKNYVSESYKSTCDDKIITLRNKNTENLDEKKVIENILEILSYLSRNEPLNNYKIGEFFGAKTYLLCKKYNNLCAKLRTFEYLKLDKRFSDKVRHVFDFVFKNIKSCFDFLSDICKMIIYKDPSFLEKIVRIIPDIYFKTQTDKQYIFKKNSICDKDIKFFIESHLDIVMDPTNYVYELTSSFLVDYYVIGRMFKKHNNYSDIAHNSILLFGDAHIYNYKYFLSKIGFDIKYSHCKDIDIINDCSRCVILPNFLRGYHFLQGNDFLDK